MTVTRTETGSQLIAALEAVWSAIRERNADVPEVVIITGAAFKTGRMVWGHYGHNFWSNGRFVVDGDGVAEREHKPELFVGGEAIANGAAFVLETMLHEAAHGIAKVRGVKDTSRQGRYHNGEFRKLAEEVGLAWTRERPDSTHGFSGMELTEAARKDYADVIAELDETLALRAELPSWLAALLGGKNGQPGSGEVVGGGRSGKAGGPAKPKTGPRKAVCECEQPRIIRVAPSTLEEAPITCGVCEADFRLAD